jgi:hypothetical protein
LGGETDHRLISKVDALEQPGAWRSTPWLLRTNAALSVGRLRVSSCPNTSGEQTFLPGTYLPFPKAAKRTGIRSDRQRYHDALEELEYEGAIEWDPSARYARGEKHYLITQSGLDDLGSAGTSAGTIAILDGQRKLFEG